MSATTVNDKTKRTVVTKFLKINKLWTFMNEHEQCRRHKKNKTLSEKLYY